ncbi:MAG: hypothetical protein Q4A05_06585 [Ruminococcus sp.]|nr:hypothetical protein [Ruminococcus sp.]
MKNYEEMARDVLQRVNEYETERKARRTRITKVAAAVTPVCAAALVGTGLWYSGALMHADKPVAPADSNIITEKVTVTESSKSANSGSSSVTVTNKTKPQSEQEEATGATSEELASRAGAPWKPSSETTEPAEQTETVEVTTAASANVNAETKQTEAATQTNSAETTAAADEHYLWCIFCSTIEWNGITYNDNTEVDVSAYTQDKYIGKVSEFSGTYKDSVNYVINPDDSVYTTKENPYVLLVVKAEPYPFYGSVIAMTNPEYLNGVVAKKYDNTDNQVSEDEVVEYNGAFNGVFF